MGPLSRLCYIVVRRDARWEVQTSAAWPDALARSFSDLGEALSVASIAARVEWESNQCLTFVCVQDAKGLRVTKHEFGWGQESVGTWTDDSGWLGAP